MRAVATVAGVATVTSMVAGCGAGFLGEALTGLSTTAVALDAGQTYTFEAQTVGGTQVTWSLSGTDCAGTNCGVLSSTTGGSVQYTAPATVTKAQNVELRAATAGTQTIATTATIALSPHPSLKGVALPAMVQGATYSAQLSVAGGMAPFQWSVTGGSLPAGMSLDAATGRVSGTPTAAGNFTFQAQIADASATPAIAQATYTMSVVPPATGVVPLAITTTGLPTATLGLAYTASIGATGGTAPYSCALTSGSLPAGLSLNACTISGRMTGANGAAFTIQVKDASSPVNTAASSFKIQQAASPLTLLGTTLANGTAGLAYSSNIAAVGGVNPYTCSVTGGGLPGGLTLKGCTVTGVPSGSGSGSVTIQVKDAQTPSAVVSGGLSWTIAPGAAAKLAFSTAALPAGTVGAAYRSTIALNGGTAPYSCSVAGGSLPAGVTLAGCTVSGTPTRGGSGSVTIAAADAGSPSQSANAALAWSVQGASLTLSTTSLPAQAIGTAYSTALGITGGTSPYVCSLAGGTLPAGVVLNGCTVTGKATQAGAGSATIKVTDGSAPQASTTGVVSWTATGSTLALSATALPQTMVGKWYTVKVPVAGGAPPYTCSVTGGQLAKGLALQGCTVVGTPMQEGTGTFSVRVADSTAQAVTGSLGLVVKPLPSTASPLSLAMTGLPNGTAGVYYSSTVSATGGKAPYTCAVAGGTLPAGLTFGGCSVTGTPTAAASAALTVKVTDASSPAQSVSGSLTLAIAPAVLTLASANMPAAVAAQPYAGSVTATGGTAPYRYSIVSGALPAGLSLAADGSISGSATGAGTGNFTAQVTDSGSPQMSASHAFSITVAASALTLNSATLPTATAGQAYTATVAVSGGTAPYTCGLVSGALPSGLSLNGCKVAGTPAATGNVTVVVKATDASSPLQTASGSLTVPVVGSPLVITTSALPNATKGVAYSTAIAVTGGSGAVSCAVIGGSLPAGLQMNAGTCSVTGTPTGSGAESLTIMAADSNKPSANTATATLPLVVNSGALSLSASLAANPVLSQAYSQQLSATGGQAPYSYSVTDGTLPRGLTLSATGVLSGTPTAAGASSFVVTVTDSAATPETTTQMFVPLVVYAAGANNAQLSGPYAFLIQSFDAPAAGDPAYQTATVGSFTADGNGLVPSGEMDSNHQGDSGTVNPVHVLGTYQVGADDRGLVTLTVLHADGTTGASSTYEIAAAAEIAADGSATAADVAAAGGEPMLNTGAPGMLLAQDKTAFAAALKGSYAFGLKGDTPCLTTCGNGVTGGPAAEVGQFTASGSGTISGGTSDSAIATTNYQHESLSGSYGAADSNGRVTMTLNTAGTPAGVYPSSYAVYVVDANQALLMSNDSHATHVLLSGTAQLQTQSSFANSAMNGAFVGAINATADPASLGVALGVVSSAGTATVFRGTATGDGSCAITNVDVAGGTQLTAAVQAAGVNISGVTALLGARAVTGGVNCAVTAEGRGVLTAPAAVTTITGILNNLGLTAIADASKVFYLTSPGRGYFLDTGYAALGSFEPQTGSAVSSASLKGTYRFGTGAASSASSESGSGVVTANGSGSMTMTPDAGLNSSGQLISGTTQTVTYTVSDAAAGRISANGAVLYAVSPDRLLRLDEGTSVASPSVGSVQR